MKKELYWEPLLSDAPEPQNPTAPVPGSQPRPVAAGLCSKWMALCLLLMYFLIGMSVYYVCEDGFGTSTTKTHWIADAVYFSVVTLTTVGYGDIYPRSTATKIWTTMLVVLGVWVVDCFLSLVLSDLLNRLEEAARINRRNGWLWRRMAVKLSAAFFLLLLCLVSGLVFLRFYEHFDWVDAVYLSVISLATVGYGDQAFEAVQGRVFASIWLLISTIAMSSFFLYFGEVRCFIATAETPEFEEIPALLEKAKSALTRFDGLKGEVDELLQSTKSRLDQLQREVNRLTKSRLDYFKREVDRLLRRLDDLQRVVDRY